MRLFAFVAALSMVVITSAPASAAWEEYLFEDLGIAKEFPVEPTRSQTVYRGAEFSERRTAVAGRDRPATLLSVEVDNIIFRMFVVDFSDKIEQSASILGECVYLAEDAGVGEGKEVLANMNTRVEPGANAVYGRLITVDLGEEVGRKMTACFFTKGNLYQIEAHVLPAHGDMNSPFAVRFGNSMRFNIEHDYGGDEAEAAAAWQYYLEHGEYPDEDDE